MRPSPNVTLKNTLFVTAALLAAVAAYTFGNRITQAAADNPQVRLAAAQKDLAAGDGAAALALFKPLAKSGNALADYGLADIYANGIGVPRDEAKSIDYMTKAADKGLIQAEASLGRLYAAGDQTVQDFGKAQIWLNKAALQGDAASERRLGRLYEQGLGVTRDPIKAYAWYENAVLHGDVQAKRLRDHLVAQLAPAQLAKAETRAKTLDSQIDHVA